MLRTFVAAGWPGAILASPAAAQESPVIALADRYVAAIYQLFPGRRLDKRNFRRKMDLLGIPTPLKELSREGPSRPAGLYTFSARRFEAQGQGHHLPLLSRGVGCPVSKPRTLVRCRGEGIEQPEHCEDQLPCDSWR